MSTQPTTPNLAQARILAAVPNGGDALARNIRDYIGAPRTTSALANVQACLDALEAMGLVTVTGTGTLRRYRQATPPVDALRNAVDNAGYLDEDGLEQAVFLVDRLGPILAALQTRVAGYAPSTVAAVREHLESF